jgi:hypothetical protein
MGLLRCPCQHVCNATGSWVARFGLAERKSEGSACAIYQPVYQGFVNAGFRPGVANRRGGCATPRSAACRRGRGSSRRGGALTERALGRGPDHRQPRILDEPGAGAAPRHPRQLGRARGSCSRTAKAKTKHRADRWPGCGVLHVVLCALHDCQEDLATSRTRCPRIELRPEDDDGRMPQYSGMSPDRAADGDTLTQ